MELLEEELENLAEQLGFITPDTTQRNVGNWLAGQSGFRGEQTERRRG